MYAEINIKTSDDKRFTIMYDSVKSVVFCKGNIYIYLNEDYTARCINKYWYEYNTSTTPYMHEYQGCIVESSFISKK